MQNSLGMGGSGPSRGQLPLRQRMKKVTLRDLLFYMETEKETCRSTLLYKSYLKWCSPEFRVTCIVRIVIVKQTLQVDMALSASTSCSCDTCSCCCSYCCNSSASTSSSASSSSSWWKRRRRTTVRFEIIKKENLNKMLPLTSNVHVLIARIIKNWKNKK